MRFVLIFLLLWLVAFLSYVVAFTYSDSQPTNHLPLIVFGELARIILLCKASQHQLPTARLTTYDKGHGRIERRSYQSFAFANEYVDERWQDCGLQTLLVVERERSNLQGISQSVDTHYYVSNAAATDSAQADELFKAIRGHWSVEVLHHCRDVSLQEDRLRTKKTSLAAT